MRWPSGTTQPGSLPDRMLTYFDNNPDEELTVADAMVKFDATYNQVHRAVGRLHHGHGFEYTPRILRKKK